MFIRILLFILYSFRFYCNFYSFSLLFVMIFLFIKCFSTCFSIFHDFLLGRHIEKSILTYRLASKPYSLAKLLPYSWHSAAIILSCSLMFLFFLSLRPHLICRITSLSLCISFFIRQIVCANVECTEKICL